MTASPQGEAKVGIVPRCSTNERLLPRIRKLSPLCTLPLSVASPGLPVPRGVSGGGAALSSLCRRFPGGDIMNLTSRRSPLSGLSFSLFSFLRERKRGYWRRSHKISVAKSKKPPTPDGINNISFFQKIKGFPRKFFQKIRGRSLFNYHVTSLNPLPIMSLVEDITTKACESIALMWFLKLTACDLVITARMTVLSS